MYWYSPLVRLNIAICFPLQYISTIYQERCLGAEFSFRLKIFHIEILKQLKHFCDCSKHQDIVFLHPKEQQSYMYVLQSILGLTSPISLISLKLIVDILHKKINVDVNETRRMHFEILVQKHCNTYLLFKLIEIQLFSVCLSYEYYYCLNYREFK